MNESDELLIEALSIATAKGQPNAPVQCVDVSLEGLAGDRHVGKPLRACSLMDAGLAAAAAASPGHPVAGEHRENLRIAGLAALPLRVLDRIQFGEVVLEITGIPATAPVQGASRQCIVGVEGVFARVQQGGALEVGQRGHWSRRPLVARVITLSDRAHAGTYEDQSGPAVVGALATFCAQHEWVLEAETHLLPDEPDALETALSDAAAAGVHLVITTGGTGIGPRDRTPDVVLRLADQTIPGIMEYVRWKYGQHNPRALLSRSVAAVLGSMLVYALPGSVRAAQEYMTEIVVTLEHVLLTLRGLDTH